jgi:hypothetical protein
MFLADYYQILKKYIDPSKLSDNYTENIYLSYPENRLNLVRTINDVETLKIVFENESDWTIRLSALTGISDENYLKKIVKENHEVSFKKHCLDKIEDQYFLRDTCYSYLKEEDSDLLIYLINRIFVKSFLEDLKKTLIKKRVVEGKIYAAIRDQLPKCSNSFSYIFD